MLIWINGAFGAGKTQTAHELARRAPGTHVADPELLGFALRKMLGSARAGDFQDLPQWRSGVLTTLRQTENGHDGPVIVPMTLVKDDYFDEIVGSLRADGVDVRHFALMANPETLRTRLSRRLAFYGGRLAGRNETWAMGQIDRCLAALATDRYATHVRTDDCPIDEVVESIAADVSLTLTQPRLSPAKYQLRRFTVGVRHIRL